MRELKVPQCLREEPRLDAELRVGAVRRRHALLINPFYAKDPHASFGKHVLTPTLALTSVAGATPAAREVRGEWDAVRVGRFGGRLSLPRRTTRRN